MKQVVLFTFSLLQVAATFAQDHDVQRSAYSFGVQYHREFVLDGYVRVREWELEGDKVKLRDLGMTNYPAVNFYATKALRNNKSLTISVDRYFMQGRATFDRDIVYNGTIIDGRAGIDVSPTRYYRASIIFSGPLLTMPGFKLEYTTALVLDHITFYLDGKVSPLSPKSEVLEGFGRQALPYPVIGFQGNINLGHHSNFNFQMSGTYIPRFQSFYTEGGNVSLQYKNFQSGISYSRNISNFQLAIGTRFRYMHLWQESNEDTNVINTITAGPYLEIVYRF